MSTRVSNCVKTVQTYIRSEPRSELGGDCVEEETEEPLSFLSLSLSFFSFLSFGFFLSEVDADIDDEDEPESGVEGERRRLLLCNQMIR